MNKSSEWKESCSEDLMDGTKSLNFERVDYHYMKGDSQDRGEVTAEKQDELLDRKGNSICCFLCNLNHFSRNYLLKGRVEWMEELQEHLVKRELAPLEEVIQPQPELTKEMVEGLEALTEH
jgi:hypothetical protein